MDCWRAAGAVEGGLGAECARGRCGWGGRGRVEGLEGLRVGEAWGGGVGGGRGGRGEEAVGGREGGGEFLVVREGWGGW